MGRSWIAGFAGLLIGVALGGGASMFSSSGDEKAGGAETASLDAPRAEKSAVESPRIEDERGTSDSGGAREADASTTRAAIPSKEAKRGDAGGLAEIGGRVTDPEGKGVPGVVIRSTPANESFEAKRSTRGKAFSASKSLDEEIEETASAYRTKTEGRAESVTDGDGAYRLTGLSPGRHSLAAAAPGLALEAVGSSTIRAGDTLDFTATPVVRVPIQVLLADGREAARANLSWSADRRSWSELWTPDDPVVLVKAGSYEVRAEVVGAQLAANGLSEESASPKTKIDVGPAEPPRITLKLEPRVGIRGRVVHHPELSIAQDFYVQCIVVPANQAFDPRKRIDNSNNGNWNRGGSFEFTDLKPGRYAVVLRSGWGGRPLVHELVELRTGVETVSLELSGMDTSGFVTATVKDAAGKLVKASSFDADLETKRGSSNSEFVKLERRDGRYWLVPDDALADYLAGGAADTKLVLTVKTESLGDKKVDVAPGTKVLDIVFRKPASLTLTIAGYVGSGYEGKLRLNLQPKSEQNHYRYYSHGENQIEADGTAKLGPVEPGDYVLTMSAQSSGEFDFSSTTNMVEETITLVEGDNHKTLTIPSLHKLTVIVKGATSGNVFLQTFEGSFVGSADVADGQVVFENIAAGEYRVRYQEGLSMASAKIRVPDVTTVTLVPAEPNSLIVEIRDANGAFAKAGFHDGDVVIGVNDTEFADSGSLMGGMASIMGKEKSTFIVMRGAKRLEIEFEGKKLMTDPGASGGSLEPFVR